MKRSCSIILAAHGTLADDSDQSLFELADSIAQAGDNRFAVTPAFLQGEPLLREVLDSTPSGDVIVIPLMTSEGYYWSQIPSLLQGNRNTNEHQIQITPAIGVHPRLPSIISRRVSTLLGRLGWPSEDTTVVVVGHGTLRHKNSCQATVDLTKRLRKLNPSLNFVAGFLDQHPSVQVVASQIGTPKTLVVPFLICPGPHATIDVPAAFGLSPGPQNEFPIVQAGPRDAATCVCDRPVGTYPEIERLCREMVNKCLLVQSSTWPTTTSQRTKVEL